MRKLTTILAIILLFLVVYVVTLQAASHYIRLSWVPSTSVGITQQDIYRAINSGGTCGSYTQIGVVQPTVTTYDDSTAIQGTNYCYVVRAFNGVDESPDSNVAQATIPFPPTAPTGLAAVAK